MRKIYALLITLLWTAPFAGAGVSTTLSDLRVQHSVEPLTVEEAHPLFSWKMVSPQPGQRQVSYRITVARECDGRLVWDSGEVRDSLSTGIPYQGVALQPNFSYGWNLTVTDGDGASHEASSRFETGLMSPKRSAWRGATWIGDHAPSLDAASLHLFSIQSDVTIAKGGCAGFLFGADDFRLSNVFYNSFNLAGPCYFKALLDLGGFGTDGGCEIRVYRVGYAPGDSPDQPLLTLNKKNYPGLNLNDILKTGTAGEHSFGITVDDGTISFEVDGAPVSTESSGEATAFVISPLGKGFDVNTFPHLCSVGFAAGPDSDVTYSNYRIDAGGQSREGPLFFGARDYRRFERLSYVRLPRYRNQSAYEMDIVVINKGETELVETIDPSHGGAKMLRTEFSTAPGRALRKAKLYATALGVYKLYLNGQAVGEDWFAPGASQYRDRVTYQAYDVTELLKDGRNALGAELFGGWYSGFMSFDSHNYNFYGDTQALLCRLDLTYEDGTSETVVSSPEGWKVFDGGPVRAGSFFQGERYDARREEIVKGWTEPGFNDHAWKSAEPVHTRIWVDPDITARKDGLVRVREVLQAQGRKYLAEDDYTFIYDMGVNMVGVPEITIPAGWLKRGDVVILRYAEQLYPGEQGDEEEYVRRFGPAGRNIAGHMLYETNRSAMDTDFYIAAGDGETVIRPRSTWRGYQYLQITIPSHAGPLPLQNVKGLVLSSCELPTGSYEAVTADGQTGEWANQLFRNIQRSQLGNFFTLPTDCPQRNERMGWTGDAQAYSRTATYNADVLNFFRQWMTALRDDQGRGGLKDVPGSIGSTVPAYQRAKEVGFSEGTTWSAAVCMVPWQLYSQYGDKQVVEENLEAMMNWLNGMAFYPLSDMYPYLSERTGGLGDWLAMDAGTPNDLVNNAIYIHMMEVTAVMAEAVGRSDYARILRERHDRAKADWNRAYVNPADGRTRALDGRIVHTQTSYATPLNFNVFDEGNQPLAEAHLATLAATPNLSGPDPQKHAAADDFKPCTITTGFSGTPNILPALSRAGRWKEAYDMFTCTALPSWLYPVTLGATSVWERWNGYDVAFSEPDQNMMNSFNHFALGAVGQWMYEYQLGISPGADAGYKHFVLQPVAGGGFLSLKGSFDSAYGRIVSQWTADADGHMISYLAEVPANTLATLYLPVGEEVEHFGEGDWMVYEGTELHNGVLTAVYSLLPGTHQFTIEKDQVLAR